LEEGLYEISVTCDMYYESSRVYLEEDGTMPEYAKKPEKATVKMRANCKQLR